MSVSDNIDRIVEKYRQNMENINKQLDTTSKKIYNNGEYCIWLISLGEYGDDAFNRKLEVMAKIQEHFSRGIAINKRLVENLPSKLGVDLCYEDCLTIQNDFKSIGCETKILKANEPLYEGMFKIELLDVGEDKIYTLRKIKEHFKIDNASALRSLNHLPIILLENVSFEKCLEVQDFFDAGKCSMQIIKLGTNEIKEFQETVTDNKSETNFDAKELREGVHMIDITKIMSVIKKINAYCKEIDELDFITSNDYQKEKNSIETKSHEMIEEMRRKYEAFKSAHFISVRSEIESLVELLSRDYEDEWKKTHIDISEFRNLTYEACENKLHSLISSLNGVIKQLNAVDFDELVPPVEIEIKGESFTVRRKGDRAKLQDCDCDSSSMEESNDTKPISGLAKEAFSCCKKTIECINTLMKLYDKQFDIEGYNSLVNSSAKSWLAEYKSKTDSRYKKRFDELFVDEKAEAIPENFFTTLIDEGKRYDVKLDKVAKSFNESITIGNAKLLVEEDTKHLGYIKKSSSLKNYLDNGYLAVPLILNLKKCGNIFLNIDEENYSNETIDFVNQLIIQFLLSFPANRINFCLIDTDNKIGFSQFKSLTKINNDILLKGIIRDERLLDTTIRDMEQTMYKINDDFLSYNNVSDIFEYNKNFEANPQSIHLFVFANYPTGMRDDISKRVLKIIQNGNKAGIFSIIINNKACPLSPAFKQTEYAQFVDYAEKASLVINKKKNAVNFSLNMAIKNSFEPTKGITLSALPSVIEILKNAAESNNQKNVLTSQMFKDTDMLAASPRGIPSSARVLDIPIGARGVEIQTLRLQTEGGGSSHGVIIGGTGSGKSNLLHTIIMNACYKYSPEELNIYLLDLKEGVEFKYYDYNRLPHVKLLGVKLKDDLYSALAILKNLRKIMSERGNIFTDLGISEIHEYQEEKKIPKILVIIDEIQELFALDAKVADEAILHLSELFKQGRAFGINFLWASQNIPKNGALKDNVVSQIGNRISLQLEKPDDAQDIDIDPKAVRALNRPEKGLGVIRDRRTGNDSVEFRVAFAEKGENRKPYIKAIVDKWKHITDSTIQEPLFIVGGNEEALPTSAGTIYEKNLVMDTIEAKKVNAYTLQLGQDYVTGKPFNINMGVRKNKQNLLVSGGDIDILRDMMGYSLLSVILNQVSNVAWREDKTKIYYANGERLNEENVNDLFNVIYSDFGNIIENISSPNDIVNCIKNIYKVYQKRCFELDTKRELKNYSPYFVVIHSLQRYSDVFVKNPSIKLNDSVKENPIERNVDANNELKRRLMNAAKHYDDQFAAAMAPSEEVKEQEEYSTYFKEQDTIFFSNAFSELLEKGGEVGINFIISTDNPLAIPIIKNNLNVAFDFKVFTKGINSDSLSQLLGDYKLAATLNNAKVAMVSYQGDISKFRVYRYEPSRDSSWYKKLYTKYNKVLED